MKILSLDPFPAREISVTPQLLPLFMFHEVELGATTNEVAIALGGGRNGFESEFRLQGCASHTRFG
jgi:hypothetical protein